MQRILLFHELPQRGLRDVQQLVRVRALILVRSLNMHLRKLSAVKLSLHFQRLTLINLRA